jgi:dUTP pyrophosphatase
MDTSSRGGGGNQYQSQPPNVNFIIRQKDAMGEEEDESQIFNPCNTIENVILLKMDKDAVPPRKFSPGSIGWDIAPSQNYEIGPNECVRMTTGIAMRPPPNHMLKIENRSSVVAKKGLEVMCGIIDQDYSSPFEIVVKNRTNDVVNVPRGFYVAQICCYACTNAHLLLTKSKWNNETSRGSFGSSDETSQPPPYSTPHIHY